MATVNLEGLGAAIAFAASDFESDLITLSLPERAREVIDTTHQGTETVKTSMPGKLIDPGQVSAEFVHDPAAATLIKGQPQTITVTYPKRTGQSTGDTLSFTGFVVNEGGEEFSVGTRLTTKVTIQVTSDYEYTPGGGS